MALIWDLPAVAKRMCGSLMCGMAWDGERHREAYGLIRTPKFQLIETQRDIRRCGREVACAPLDQGPPPPKTPAAICSASFHLCISPVPFHRLDPLIVEVKDAGAKWHAARMGIAGWCCGWRNFVCVSNACPERDEGPRVTAVILERVPLRRRIEIQNAPSEIRVGCNLHFRPDILRGLPWSSAGRPVIEGARHSGYSNSFCR